jgi:tRNA modification GTPase
VMNGKLDVLEAESILALVGAETEQQLSLAHAIKDSRDKLMKYRARLIDLLSELEAFIDFSDDTQMVLHNVEHLKTEAAALLCEF